MKSEFKPDGVRERLLLIVEDKSSAVNAEIKNGSFRWCQ
jgi:hypothetical protein